MDRLAALLPGAEPTGTRHVGVGDVEFIEQLTANFRGQFFTYGSGLVHRAALAQLRTALPLLDAEVTAEVWPRLQLATAVHFVVDMACQAEYLGRPDEMLHLLRIGRTVADSGPHSASAAETTCLAVVFAAAHAMRGEEGACDRALGEAVDQFSAIDPAAVGPWTTNITSGFLAARQGHAHYTLALVDRDARAAGRAVPLLRRAIELYGPGYATSQALYLPELVGAHAIAGDLDTAVTLGH